MNILLYAIFNKENSLSNFRFKGQVNQNVRHIMNTYIFN